MKTRTASIIVLLVAFTTLALNPLSAGPSPTPATIYQVSSIEKYGAPSIVPGDSAQTVQRYLGQPDEKLSPNIWVYYNFHPSHDQAVTDACTTVLITFAEGCIADIKGVNGAALKVIVARLAAARADPDTFAVAAK